MELRGEENDIRTPVPSNYGHQPTGGETRRDGHHNGTTVVDHANQSSSSLTHIRSPNQERILTLSATSNSNVRYGECLRNHAASVGGNIFDGCGEFMPGGQDGTPEALKCAACECHRSFHRKEVDGDGGSVSHSCRRNNAVIHGLQLAPPFASQNALHHQRYSVVQPVSVFGGGSVGTDSSSEDLNPLQSNVDGASQPPPPFLLSKKRFRTKFTPEQKDKMMEFAEKVGWRINKQDEELVEKFCAGVGVRRQVFKVWMHNNKSLKNHSQTQQQPHQQPQQHPL